MYQKSPGGSLFPYYYNGGILHNLKYGSFYRNEKALFVLMDKEKDFILSQAEVLNIWIDFYKTRISKNVVIKLNENIEAIKIRVNRLAIVGLSCFSKLKINAGIKNINIPVNYFSDPEEAKTWITCG